MALNVHRRLLDLLPDYPVLAAFVVSAHSDGTATVQYPGGGTQRVRDPFTHTSGQAVLVQKEAVIGAGQALPHHELEVGA